MTTHGFDKEAPTSGRGRRGAGQKGGVHKKASRLAKLGPAIIVSAWVMGDGNVTTAIATGAQTGYSMLWLLVVSAVLMFVYLDMGIRIGMKAPASPITIIKERFSRPVGTLAGVSMFLAGLSFSTGNAIGTALAAELIFGGSVIAWATGITAVVIAFLWIPGNTYALLEKLMIALLGLMLTLFAATVFFTGTDVGGVVGGLIPNDLPSSGNVLLVLALLGTSFTLTGAFYAMYSIREKGTRVEDYKETTLVDTLPGVVAPGLMTALILIASAAVLAPLNKEVDSAADLASALVPIAGDAAFVIFGVGYFAAGFTSLIVNATVSGSLLSDGFGRGYELSRTSVRVFGTIVPLVGLFFAILLGDLPIAGIITAQALIILVMPLLGGLMILLANDKRLMGSLANSRLQNLIAGLGWAFVVATSVQLGFELASRFA